MTIDSIAPSTRPFAVLSDLHGHRTALEAVLEELRRRDVQDIYVAGDLLLGGADPLGTWRVLQRVGARCVRGLSDRALVEVDVTDVTPGDDAEAERLEAFLKTRSALGELVLEQMRRLPERLRIPLIDGNEGLVVHGSPGDPTAEMSHVDSDDTLLALVDDDPASLVFCGATHVPFQRNLGEVRVVNVGTVGAAPEGAFAHFTTVSPKMDGALIHQDVLALA